MKKSINSPLSYLIIALLLIQMVVSLRTPAQTAIKEEAQSDPQPPLARLSEEITIKAGGRGNPFINLSNGLELLTGYVGDELSSPALEGNQARGLSLASDDFDEDGTADLVCGYAISTGGIVALHRGSGGKIAERNKPNSAPFLAGARVFRLPEAAEFLGTGDFNADGHNDLIAASSTGASLYLLRGDGLGSFSAPERIELSGTVTAIVAGEMNRADGIEDLVIGIIGPEGPRVLVYEGPDGALRTEPEVFSLSARVTSLAIGQLDSSYEYDLAITAGNELLIAHGRDRKLSMDKQTRSRVPAATISRQDFPFKVAAVATGEFIREGYQTDIAVLSEDGRVRYLKREEAQTQGEGEWRTMTETVVSESFQAGDSPSPRLLVTADISGLATDDLMLIDEAGRKIHVISGGPGSPFPLHTTTSLDVQGEPVAVMPLRMSGAAVKGFAALSDNRSAPALILPAALVTITVTTSSDNGNNDAPTPGSLREAIIKANNAPSSDPVNIEFLGDMQIDISAPLPTIAHNRVIINDDRKQVTINNGGGIQFGLFITGSDSNVKGMTFSGFSTGIRLEGGRDGFLGFNSISGGRIGVEIVNSDSNSIQANNIMNTDFAGVRITGTSKENEVQQNTITENRAGAIIDGNAANNKIGGLIAGVVKGGNAILRNDVGVLIGGNATGNRVQGNVIVDTSQDGLLVTEQGAFNFIGGTTDQLGNKIIGSGANGIRVGTREAEGTKIQGNFIGIKDDTTPAPASGEGNKGDGVRIEGAPKTETGGASKGAGNTIGKNKGDGVSINNVNTGPTLVQGNKIGTDPTGATTDPDGNPNSGDETGNLGDGIKIVNSSLVTVGGTDPQAANIVGGNNNGVSLINSSNNTIKGNFWGTNPASANLGNKQAGAKLTGTSSNNSIGGGDPGAGNTFAFNSVAINASPGANGNLYLFNRIYENILAGIDNINGANRNIAPPQLSSAVASASDTLITGRFLGPPNRQIALHFYLSSNSSSPGQGKDPFGGIIVTTNSAGSVDFNARFNAALPPLRLTGLASDVTTNDTSRFSNDIDVTSTARPDLEVKKTGPETAKCGETITWRIEVRNVGTGAAIGASITDILPACVGDEVQVTTSQEGSFTYPEVSNKVVTVLPRLDPGAPPLTITVRARLTQICDDSVVNLVKGEAEGDTNTSNDEDDPLTKVDCTKITGITTSGKHVTVSGIGFQKGDMIEINGVFAKKTKFIDVDELFAKKGNKLLLPCDPANPGRTNVIRLIRSRNPGLPVLDTQAFATCPGG
jgi:uncharacterized repeat protein (TIGR01451 family)